MVDLNALFRGCSSLKIRGSQGIFHAQLMGFLLDTWMDPAGPDSAALLLSDFMKQALNWFGEI